MTDDFEEVIDGRNIIASGSGKPTVEITKDDILEFLSNNSLIYFKSQQIDDPELTVNEKKTIAENIFDESFEKFLSRFGKYLEMKHLEFFESLLEVKCNLNDIKFIINDLKNDIINRNKYIKNRRFAAMQAMIKENNYFTEKEMMQREPYLYEQMVGQYLTENEKLIRDGVLENDIPFSRILLNGLDRDYREELKKKQEQDEDQSDSTSEKTADSLKANSLVMNDEMFPKIPTSFRKHWGGFDDEPDEIPAKRMHRNEITTQITASEREMLRQEFVEIMYSKFLNGNDKDFNYGQVDDNTDYDDLEQIAQDDEDKYFDEDSPDENIQMSRSNSGSEEDELDIFMDHLNRTPSLENGH